MKKLSMIFVSVVLLGTVLSPLAKAQTVPSQDNAQLQVIINSALQKVIDLLIQEVTDLEARLAVLEANSTSTSPTATTTPAAPSQTAPQPSVLPQLQSVAPQVVQPVVVDTTPPLNAINPCSNQKNLKVWWQDPCSGKIGVFSSSTLDVTYTMNDSNFFDVFSNSVAHCVDHLIVTPSSTDVTVVQSITMSNDKGNLSITITPSLHDEVYNAFQVLDAKNRASGIGDMTTPTQDHAFQRLQSYNSPHACANQFFSSNVTIQ